MDGDVLHGEDALASDARAIADLRRIDECGQPFVFGKQARKRIVFTPRDRRPRFHRGVANRFVQILPVRTRAHGFHHDRFRSGEWTVGA